MKTWLKDNGTVIGALAGVVVAFVALIQLLVVGPMNRGFSDLRSDMNARFDIQHRYIEARFDAVDQRFEAVDQRFDDMNRSVDQRFDDLRDEMNQRFNRLTDEVSALRTLVAGISERVSRNEGAIGVIREQLQADGTSPPGP